VPHALGDGLRAALIEDPVGLVILPLILHFPNVVLEALQARFAGDLEGEVLRNAPLGLALSVGWGFALAGRLLGQALVIRRTAARLTGASRGRWKMSSRASSPTSRRSSSSSCSSGRSSSSGLIVFVLPACWPSTCGASPRRPRPSSRAASAPPSAAAARWCAAGAGAG